MPWSEVLERIRSGDEVIKTDQNGLPVETVIKTYELMQLVAALTEGYNRNAKRIKMLRKMLKANQPKKGE